MPRLLPNSRLNVRGYRGWICLTATLSAADVSDFHLTQIKLISADMA